nr:putative late blight resistance protein homolog R1B-14 isoform X1 [Ipomoea batatas]
MIQSLCKKLRFLQAFLEDSQKNNINCPAWSGLETEIRDVAAEAERKIESQLYKHYLFYNEKTEIRDVPVKPCQSLHQTLQQEAFINDYQWCKLRCLQTIIIFGYLASFTPNSILGMPQIRHVHISQGILNYLHLPKLVQRNLQTLSWLILPQRLQTEPDFKGIPNVKELGIRLMGYDPYYKMHSLSEKPWGLLPHISMEGLLSLHQLENLKFETSQWSPECDLKLLKAFPPNLKMLTLKGTHFSWEDMTIINTLPNLEALKLREDAFCGPEWKATGNGFSKLKYLEVTAHSSLKRWSVDADHFPILECIFLNQCHLLVEFPTGFGNTLQLIDLKNCSSLLVTSAKDFQDERRDLGDDKLVIREFYTASEICRFTTVADAIADPARPPLPLVRYCHSPPSSSGNDNGRLRALQQEAYVAELSVDRSFSSPEEDGGEWQWQTSGVSNSVGGDVEDLKKMDVNVDGGV